MNVKPLADAYERLKELRRRADSGDDIHSMLRALHDKVVAQRFVDEVVPDGLQGAIVRTVEVRTLADRVFGDERRADAWLKRPNATLSGQRPVDLLKDELGAAVVREMLERIDHGIFA